MPTERGLVAYLLAKIHTLDPDVIVVGAFSCFYGVLFIISSIAFLVSLPFIIVMDACLNNILISV